MVSSQTPSFRTGLGYRQLALAGAEAMALFQEVSSTPCIPHPSCKAGVVTAVKGIPMVSWDHGEEWDVTAWLSGRPHVQASPRSY